ncbi:MAG: DUF4340 domain-containing protein [Bacteroidia bacterium]
MKRLLWGFGALVLVLGVYLILNSGKEGKVTTETVEFAVEDPSVIDKIMMKDRSGKTVVLRKTEKGEWWVNEEYPAFQPNIDLFLNKTLNRITVKGPVAQTAKDNVIRSMVSDAVRVDIHSKGELIRSYYVGSYTPDMRGTYMHVEGSDIPFIAYIPGFDGYITPKFNLNKTEWYSRSVFDYEPEEIKEIGLIYHADSSASYTITRVDGNFALAGEPNTSINQQAAKSYFALFKFKNFEGYATYLNQAQKDSIKNSQPAMTLVVEDVLGNKRTLRAFTKGSSAGGTLRDKHGNLLTYDQERYFATFSGLNKLVTIQEYTFGKLFAIRSDFTL